MNKWNEKKLLGELSQIHDIYGLKQFAEKHGTVLKKLLLPAAVLFAFFFFWISGNADPAVQITEETAELQDTAAEGAEGSAASPQTLSADSAESIIYVDIGGEVMDPGVYQAQAGTRLFQIIELAGGLKDSADTDRINQAETVSDGQKIIIGSRDETSPYYTGTFLMESTGEAAYRKDDGPASQAVTETADGYYIINLNLATLQELELLPGVGPSTAQKIIDYREKNGPFQTIEDIKNISGIGDKTFSNLKDYIIC